MNREEIKIATDNSVIPYTLRKRLEKLSKKADKVRSDPKLRHTPNERDLKVVSENVRLMHSAQYETIKSEGDDSQ